jgi:GNAT superfamily N-acetyltransferase
LVWIKKYFWIEDMDLKVLGNPESEIIEKGGMVFFAKHRNSVVGTGAIINHGNGLYELSKMAVDDNFQRKGIGGRIIDYTINWVKARSGKRIFIETNTILDKAVSLYKKVGFSSVQNNPGRSYYERTNLRMVLEL